MVGMDDLELLAARLGAALGQRGECLATAESCTGGGVAQALTAIAGSSAWFERGFVTYANAAKMEMLGVPESTLARHGAVSEATARAMAEGALRHSHADWSLAITGIAGPTGGTPEKPVGTVCFAWAGREAGDNAGGEVDCETGDEIGRGINGEAQTMHFTGDRAAVRAQAVRHALRGLLERLAEHPPRA